MMTAEEKAAEIERLTKIPGYQDVDDVDTEINPRTGKEEKIIHFAFRISAQTAEMIKQYVRRRLEIENKINQLKQDLKDLKREFEDEGINIKAADRALMMYKRRKKLHRDQLQEMDMIMEIFDEDAELSAKIIESIPNSPNNPNAKQDKDYY